MGATACWKVLSELTDSEPGGNPSGLCRASENSRWGSSLAAWSGFPLPTVSAAAPWEPLRSLSFGCPGMGITSRREDKDHRAGLCLHLPSYHGGSFHEGSSRLQSQCHLQGVNPAPPAGSAGASVETKAATKDSPEPQGSGYDLIDR